MSKKTFHARRLLSFLLLAALVAGACQVFSPQPATPQPAVTPVPATAAEPAGTVVPPTAIETQASIPIPEVEAAPLPAFAKFTEPQVQDQASVQHEPIAADLSNVQNPFLLSQAQLERLGQDGFVVTPGSEKEFFTVYEKARYANVPIFVTSDSLLHSYHLLFDKLLRTAEVEHFIPLLKELNAALLAKTDEQYQALKGTSWEEPALRTVAFVGVASRLLDPQVAVPDYAQELVQAELALIEAADGIHLSPLFPYLDFGEDYTQYIPRGHYTRSDALKAYFKSMMWYGRMTFRLKPKDPEAGRAETRSALLLVQALRNSQVGGRPAMAAWADLYSPTVFFVGRSDDLTASQYIPVIDAVYGAEPALETIADDSKLDTFIEAANQLPPPRILGMVISDQDDEEAETKGLRFMGQRFVPDAYIFRQLIYRNVGPNETTGDPRRGLPKGLDLMAAMGSERAYAILEEEGDTGHANYPEQFQKVKKWLDGLSVDEWTETLYNSWIYTFFPLLEVPGEGYPAFMRSDAWLDKQLNTTLGSWAELKHDTILYAKQVYAEMGGGPPPPEPVPPKGYVEPVPAFYARLAALTAMTREGLESRGLLSEVDAANLQRLEELSQAFQIMAEKELRGEALTQAEYDLIRFYGGDLEHLVMAAADTDNADEMGDKYMDEEPQVAVVADVATDPDPNGDGSANPIVQEEAVGRVDELHAVVPIVLDDGSTQLQVAKGGVFSYYEFEWPAEDRLTDEKWRTMLEEGKEPEQPEWTASFRTDQGAYSDLQTAIQSFQLDLRNLMWEPAMYDPANYEPGMAPFGPPMDPFQAEASELRAAKEYVGKQLVSVQFNSYDLQSEDRALVTVRETWQDKRYQGEYPDFEQPVIAQRGPYTVKINYTLERNPETTGLPWLITKVDYLEPLPEWQTPLRKPAMSDCRPVCSRTNTTLTVPMFRMRILLLVFLIMALLTGARSMPRIEEAGPWVYLRDDKPLSANEGAVEVLAVGDVNLARGMAEVTDPFAGTAAWLRSADVAIGNLECVVAGTADDGRSTIDEAQEAGRKPYVLIAPSEAAEKLAGAGFDLLGVANNHSLDAGLDGLEVTAEHLKAAGIEPVGAGVNSQGASSPVIRTVKGVRLAFLAFNDVAEGEGNLTPPAPLPDTGRGENSPFPTSERGRGVRSIARWDPEISLAAVRQARLEADGVIVSIHWGYEYERRRDPAQAVIAQALLDAGADVVIGHHPHVAQEVTLSAGDGASGQLVAFSLGNFAFDQSFGDTRQGLAMRLFFDRQGLRAAQVLPLSAGPHPRLISQDEAASLLERVLASKPLASKPLASKPIPEQSLPDHTDLAYTCDPETCTPAATTPTMGSGVFTAGRADLTGDGLPEEIRLDGQRLSIYEKGVKTWESPPEWQVSDLATGDPDGDGREDLMLALWKPDKQGVVRSHPFVFGYRGGRYRTIWGGSAVGRRIHEVGLGDLDGDGLQELIVLEETPDWTQRTVSVWRWHGWGFRCDWRSPAGNFKNLRILTGVEKFPPRIQIEVEP